MSKESLEQQLKVTWNDPETNALLWKVLHLQMSSCSCMTKSPDVQYHAENCRYRLAVEVHEGIVALRNQLEIERRYRLSGAAE